MIDEKSYENVSYKSLIDLILYILDYKIDGLIIRVNDE